MKHPYSEIVKSVDTEDGDYKWHISVSKDGYMEDDSKEPIIDNYKTESRDIRQA